MENIFNRFLVLESLKIDDYVEFFIWRSIYGFDEDYIKRFWNLEFQYMLLYISIYLDKINESTLENFFVFNNYDTLIEFTIEYSLENIS